MPFFGFQREEPYFPQAARGSHPDHRRLVHMKPDAVAEERDALLPEAHDVFLEIPGQCIHHRLVISAVRLRPEHKRPCAPALSMHCLCAATVSCESCPPNW
jgi:hypothetical protein